MNPATYPRKCNQPTSPLSFNPTLFGKEKEVGGDIYVVSSEIMEIREQFLSYIRRGQHLPKVLRDIDLYTRIFVVVLCSNDYPFLIFFVEIPLITKLSLVITIGTRTRVQRRLLTQ